MISIIKAKYLNDYKIQLYFNSGRSGSVDLKDIITQDAMPIFHQLIDIDLFKNFKVEYDTIVWSNDLDIAPEFIYFQAFKDDSQ